MIERAPRRLVLLALVVAAVWVPAVDAPAQQGATESSSIDWDAWRRLPVFSGGRVMPLNTFARQAAEEITGRVKLQARVDWLSAGDVPTPGRLRRLREMLPEEGRDYQAPELLFAWMAEPRTWMYIPCIEATHEELRTDLLGVPLVGPDNQRLKHVSAYQIEQAEALRDRLMEIQRRRGHGESEPLDSLDRAALELEQRYRHFLMLARHPETIPLDAVASPVMEAALLARRMSQTMQRVTPALGAVPGLDRDSLPLAEHDRFVTRLDVVQQLLRSGQTDVAQLDRRLDESRRLARELAVAAGALQETVFEKTARDPDWTAQVRAVRRDTLTLSSRADAIESQMQNALMALYDSGDVPRVVPSLNPEVLRIDRSSSKAAEPWVSLWALTFAPDNFIRTYVRPDLATAEATEGPRPEAAVDETTTTAQWLETRIDDRGPTRPVRKTMAAAIASYVDRDDPQRASEVEKALRELADVLRTLGQEVAPHRATIALDENQDEADREAARQRLDETAYPPPGATSLEVQYYDVDPFFWTWVLCAASLALLALTAFRPVRDVLFWFGVGVLLIAQALAVYGFTLRVIITGWAPVTNMFETIVFVAFGVALMGVFFSLQPLLGPGLRRAWILSAVPWTPEAAGEAFRRETVGGKIGWCALLLLRAAFVLGLLYWTGLLTPGPAKFQLLPDMAMFRGISTAANEIFVWLAGLGTFLILLWSLPRGGAALVGSLVTIPIAWGRHGLVGPAREAVSRRVLTMAGAAVALLAGIVAYYAPIFDADIKPVTAVLRDNFWLTLHVLSITASYSAGALAWALGVVSLGYYTFGRYRPGGEVGAAKLPPEPCTGLGHYIYRSMQVAMVLLVIGTVLGGLWADVAWGRFWGWDAKEVWALISLLIYTAVVHVRKIFVVLLPGRNTSVLADFGLAIGSVVGMCAILMAWYGVNYVLASGMHTYGHGSGGTQWLVLVVVVNFLWTIPPSLRYYVEVHAPDSGPPTEPSADTSP